MCYAMDAVNNYDSARQQLQTIEEMQTEIRDVNEANGWFDEDRTFGEEVALLHSEASEMLEAYRRWGLADATPVTAMETTLAKPEGVGSEAADVLIRLLDTCERYGINLRAEYVRKIAYNRTRGYRHGGKRA